jgi:hypothetical protein
MVASRRRPCPTGATKDATEGPGSCLFELKHTALARQSALMRINKLLCIAQSGLVDKLSIDLETMTITDDRRLRIPFTLDAYRRSRLLKGLDDIGQSWRKKTASQSSRKAARYRLPPSMGQWPSDLETSTQP